MVYTGTVVTFGRGSAIVNATGMKQPLGVLGSFVQGSFPQHFLKNLYIYLLFF